PNISALDYFLTDGIEGKLYLSVLNSGESTFESFSYMISEVIGAREVIIDVDGISSGTSGACEIFVSADANRNFDLGGNVWKNASPVVPTTNSEEGVT